MNNKELTNWIQNLTNSLCSHTNNEYRHEIRFEFKLNVTGHDGVHEVAISILRTPNSKKAREEFPCSFPLTIANFTGTSIDECVKLIDKHLCLEVKK
jgi:hypothetical protein